MNIHTAKTAFVLFLTQRTGATQLPSAAQGFDALFDFYAAVRADDCPVDNDGDMMLFEWGPYVVGDAPADQVSLTRQLLAEDGEDDDLFQLTLTYQLPVNTVLGGLEPEGYWCMSPADLDGFRTKVYTSPAYIRLLGHPEATATLTFDNAG